MVWNLVFSVFFASLESSRSEWKINTAGCAPNRIFLCVVEKPVMSQRPKALLRQWLEVCTKAAHLILSINFWWIRPRWGTRMSLIRQTQKEHEGRDALCLLPQTRQGINHGFSSGCPSVITAVKLRKSRCCSTLLWNARSASVLCSFPLQNTSISRNLDSFLLLQFQYLCYCGIHHGGLHGLHLMRLSEKHPKCKRWLAVCFP